MFPSCNRYLTPNNDPIDYLKSPILQYMRVESHYLQGIPRQLLFDKHSSFINNLSTLVYHFLLIFRASHSMLLYFYFRQSKEPEHACNLDIFHVKERFDSMSFLTLILPKAIAN